MQKTAARTTAIAESPAQASERSHSAPGTSSALINLEASAKFPGSYGDPPAPDRSFGTETDRRSFRATWSIDECWFSPTVIDSAARSFFKRNHIFSSQRVFGANPRGRIEHDDFFATAGTSLPIFMSGFIYPSHWLPQNSITMKGGGWKNPEEFFGKLYGFAGARRSEYSSELFLS